jgi:hypothetical protein
VSLSDDNVPLLAQTYQSAAADSRLKSEMGAALTCKLYEYDQSLGFIEGTPQSDFWGSYTFSKSRAGHILTGLKPELKKNYLLIADALGYHHEVKTPHGVIDCDQSFMGD